MKRWNLTYQAPSQLYRSDSLFQKHYSDCLHITATSSLKDGLGESLRAGRWINAPIITFSELLSEISGSEWASSKAKLKQFLYLSEVLSRKWNSADTDRKRRQLQAMERNQNQLLKTLRTLTELGIDPPENDIPLNTTEKLFVEIWISMEKYLKQSCANLYRFFRNRNSIHNNFVDALISWGATVLKGKEAKGNLKRTRSNLDKENLTNSINNSLRKKKLIFHGFYFITPVQELLINYLQNTYEIIFLNCYDKRFPGTFETVAQFLRTDEYETKNVVDENIKIHPLAVKLLETFEGKTDRDSNNKYKINEYKDLLQFIETEKLLQTENKEEDYHLLTPRAEEIKDQLIANQFITPLRKRKLTDYPFGQFLLQIHQLVDRETDVNTGEVILKENITTDKILNLFASGCLISNGKNMKQYLRPLEKIVPFFKDVSTFQEWFKRFRMLKNEKKKWEQDVLAKNPQALNSRKHKFHAFPMRQLSYFSVDIKDINSIEEGLRNIKKIFDNLFMDIDKRINIGMHLDALEQFVLKDVEGQFQEAEETIIKEIMEDISELRDEGLQFSLKDLITGLSFYLDGTLQSLDEGDSPDDVNSFERADAAPFQLKRRFHLAFADQQALPISQKPNLWPVSKNLLSYLGRDYPDIELLEQRQNLTSSINRYLLYLLFHCAEDLRFSYVKSLGLDSDLEPAIYFELLGFSKEKLGQENKVLSYRSYNDSSTDYNPEDLNWSDSMRKEAQICPKRASFSFVLNEHTTFTEDFHHGFLYENYVTLLNKMKEQHMSTNILRDNVGKWFPQWSDMEKDFRYADIVNRYKSRKYKRGKMWIDGVSYSHGINYFHLLPTTYAGANKHDILPVNKIALDKAVPGYHCRFCPYLSICRDGTYSIDSKDNNNN